MSEILHQLGIDWKLLASQIVNFLVLLALLTHFVYRPLLKVLKERRKKIEFGLQGAVEAEKMIRAIDATRDEKLAEADSKALAIVTKAEDTAKTSAAEIINKADEKAAHTLNQAIAAMVGREKEEMNRLAKEASGLIREAIAKAVAKNPDQIDEILVTEAASIMSKNLNR